jgi:hypothetical protein
MAKRMIKPPGYEYETVPTGATLAQPCATAQENAPNLHPKVPHRVCPGFIPGPPWRGRNELRIFIAEKYYDASAKIAGELETISAGEQK